MLVALQLTGIVVHGQNRPQTRKTTVIDTTPLYNAYYLAKAIAADKKRIDEERFKKIIGGVMWYASNDFQTVKELGSLNKVLREYKTLSDRINPLISDFYTHLKKSLLAFTEEEIREGLNGHGERQLADRIIKLNKKVAELDAEVVDDKYNPDTFLLKQDRIDLDNESENLNRVQNQINNLRSDTSSFASAKLNTLQQQRQIHLTAITELTRKLRSNDSLQQKLSLLKSELRDSLSAMFAIRDQLTPVQIANLNKEQVSGKETLPTEFTAEAVDEYNTLNIHSSTTNLHSDVNPLSFQIPNQSQIIDALAIYLAKRVKQESVMWFFETLQNNMKVHKLVQDAFPNCYKLLQSNEIYEVPKMGSLWRYAISKDFVHMPGQVIHSDWFKKKLGNHPLLMDGLEKAIRVSQLIGQQYSYNDIITTLYMEIPVNKMRDDRITVNSLITMLHLLNTEFMNYGKTARRLNFIDLVHMADEEFEIMLSLLDMKYNNVVRTLFFDQRNEFVINTATQLNALRKTISNVLIKVQQIEKIKEEYKLFLDQKARNENLEFQYNDYNTWNFIKDLLLTLNFDELGAQNSFFRKWTPEITAAVQAMGSIQEVFRLLEQKNFAGSVNQLFQIIKTLPLNGNALRMHVTEFEAMLRSDKMRMYKDLADNISKAANQEKYGYVTNGETIEINQNSILAFVMRARDHEAIAFISKLAGFLNDVGYSKNSKELARVIEAYALPPGSYKMKRASWRSFDINAYVGAYYGHEWLNVKDKNGQEIKSSGGVYGLTAPIGFAFSKTLGRKIRGREIPIEIESKHIDHPERIKLGSRNSWEKTGTTFTLFFSVIDIGSVVSFRLNSEESLPTKVKWDQVISPGAHINIGIPKTPLVFATGYQYTPKLRRINADNVDQQANANRVYASIRFDLPLFNIGYSSTRVQRYK